MKDKTREFIEWVIKNRTELVEYYEYMIERCESPDDIEFMEHAKEHHEKALDEMKYILAVEDNASESKEAENAGE